MDVIWRLDCMQVLDVRSQTGRAGHRAFIFELGSIAEALLPGWSADVNSQVCDLTQQAAEDPPGRAGCIAGWAAAPGALDAFAAAP